MIENIKRELHFRILNRKLRSNNVQRKIQRFADVRDIGILFNATNTDDALPVTQFAESLRPMRKRVTMLGYYDYKKPAINFTFPYFNKKDVNWLLMPRGTLVSEFLDKPFDVLINFCTQENLPMEYIVALSKAKFRVGFYNPKKVHAYDFMIDMKEKTDVRSLVENVSRYLNMLS
jgi:hypothetical protein